MTPPSSRERIHRKDSQIHCTILAVLLQKFLILQALAVIYHQTINFMSSGIELNKTKAEIILRPQLLFVPPALFRQPSVGFLQVRIP